MCYCCLYFITKDYSTSNIYEFFLLFFGGVLSSIGLSAVPFKRCLMQSKINFHWAVYVIALINIFAALTLMLIDCKHGRYEKTGVKKVLTIFCLSITVLSLILGIILFVIELKGIMDCDNKVFVVQNELSNIINETDNLTFWNVYGTYVCNAGFCVLNLASIFFCIFTVLYVFTGTINQDELFKYFGSENKKENDNRNNLNNRNVVVIISERTYERNANGQN